MKLRLLKPLPGAEVGTTAISVTSEDEDKIPVVAFGGYYYNVPRLTDTGWAEEIKEPERWEPELGETYYKFSIYGSSDYPIGECKSFDYIDVEKRIAEYGLVTRTREELETTLLLLKLRQSNGGWKLLKEDMFFIVDDNGYVSHFSNDGDLWDKCAILLGNCYRTREEAEKYAPEWKKLFDSVK